MIGKFVLYKAVQPTKIGVRTSPKGLEAFEGLMGPPEVFKRQGVL